MIWTRAIYGPSCTLVSFGVDMPGGQDQMNFTACCRGILYCCTCENEVEFDIKVFRSLRLVLDVKEFMELPVWQLGAQCQRTRFDSVVVSSSSSPLPWTVTQSVVRGEQVILPEGSVIGPSICYLEQRYHQLLCQIICFAGRLERDNAVRELLCCGSTNSHK